MNINSSLKLTKRLVLVTLTISSTVHICYAETSAQDLGGVSQNKIREISILKATQNRDIRQANDIIDSSFGAVVQPSNKSDRLSIPQLTVIGQNQGSPESNSISAESKASVQQQNTDEGFDGDKEVSKLLAEYEEKKRVVKESAGKQQFEMLRLKQLSSTLKDVPDEYFSLGRPDIDKEINEIYRSFDERSKQKWDGLIGGKDDEFLKKLNAFDQTRTKSESAKVNDSNSSKEDIDQKVIAVPESDNNSSQGNQASSSEPNGEDSKLNENLNGIELVRSKCSGSLGSKNGSALVKLLTSGECAEAINKDPELKAKYNVKKIVELISAWGFRTASFSSSTNAKLGIDKLPELGIIFNANDPKADFKAIAYQPAVEIQQTQLLITQDDTETGPLTELMPPKDKSVLGHSVRD